MMLRLAVTNVLNLGPGVQQKVLIILAKRGVSVSTSVSTFIVF